MKNERKKGTNNHKKENEKCRKYFFFSKNICMASLFIVGRIAFFEKASWTKFTDEKKSVYKMKEIKSDEVCICLFKKKKKKTQGKNIRALELTSFLFVESSFSGLSKCLFYSLAAAENPLKCFSMFGCFIFLVSKFFFFFLSSCFGFVMNCFIVWNWFKFF